MGVPCGKRNEAPALGASSHRYKEAAALCKAPAGQEPATQRSKSKSDTRESETHAPTATSGQEPKRPVGPLEEFAAQLEEFIDPREEIRELVRQHEFVALSTPTEKPRFVRLIRCMGGENFRYFGELRERQRHGLGMFYTLAPPTLFVGRFEADKKTGTFQVYSAEGYRETVYEDDRPQS